MIDLGWLGQIAFTWEFFAAVPGREWAAQAFFILSVCAGSKWVIRRRNGLAPAVQPGVLARTAGQNEGS